MSKYEMQLHGNTLLWCWVPGRTPKKLKLYDYEPLGEFTALVTLRQRRESLQQNERPIEERAWDDLEDHERSQKAKEILSFAQKWGPIGLCVHHRPLDHGKVAGHGFDAQLEQDPDTPAGKEIDWDQQEALLLGRDQGLNASAEEESITREALRVWRRDPGLIPLTTGRRITEKEPLKMWRIEMSLCQPRVVYIGDKLYFAESLAAWWRLAKAATALHRIFWERRTNKPRPSVEPLRILTRIARQIDSPINASSGFLEEDNKDIPRSWSGAWPLISDFLNDWLVSAPVRFRCEIDEKAKLQIDFVVGDERGIFPVLTAQLLALLSTSEGATICSGCRLPFIRTRTPPRGNRAYCLGCQEANRPQRDATNDYRKREKERSKKRTIK